MTKEELVSIISKFIREHNAWDDPCSTLADRILAAIAKEREGEVVLRDCYLDKNKNTLPIGIYFPGGIRGQLIFRPTKGKGE